MSSYRDLADIVDVLPGYVFAMTPQGRCTYVNKPWADLVGRPLESFLGTGWIGAIDKDDYDRVVAEWCQAAESEMPFSSVYRVRSTDGPVWMNVQATPVYKNHGVVTYAGCGHEISEQTRDTNSVATQSLVHDLQNILAVVRGSWEVESQDGSVDEESFLVISDALDRSSALLRELQGTDNELASTDVNSLTRRVLALLAPVTPKTVTTTLALDWSIPPLGVRAPLVWRALINLVLNALQSMPDGGELTVETLRIQGPDSPSVRISIRDTGVGISEADMETIFHPQVTTRKASGGQGFGLAIVDACARRHGGRVEVESTEGVGSVFHLEL